MFSHCLDAALRCSSRHTTSDDDAPTLLSSPSVDPDVLILCIDIVLKFEPYWSVDRCGGGYFG